MLSMLMDKALDWASTIWDSDPEVKTSDDYFANLIKQVFEYLMGERHFQAVTGITPRVGYGGGFCH